MDDTWLLTIIYPKLLYITYSILRKLLKERVEFEEDEIIAKFHRIMVVAKFPWKNKNSE